MYKFTDKQSINSRLNCAAEVNLSGVTGDEVIERIVTLHEHMKAINDALAGTLPTDQSNDFEINFVFEPRVKMMWVIYSASKGTWRATFTNNNSQQPARPNPSWRNYGKNFHTYGNKSSKFEGKIFNMIRDFVDRDIVP